MIAINTKQNASSGCDMLERLLARHQVDKSWVVASIIDAVLPPAGPGCTKLPLLCRGCNSRSLLTVEGYSAHSPLLRKSRVVPIVVVVVRSCAMTLEDPDRIWRTTRVQKIEWTTRCGVESQLSRLA